MPNASLTLLLDFDGVLNNDRFLRHQRNHVHPSVHRLFDPANITALNTLCATLAIDKIVITSTWRKGRTLDEIRSLLWDEGFEHTEKVEDVTPELGVEYEARAEEILAWISRTRPRKHLILDDFDLSNLIRDGFVRVAAADGLTGDLVASIIRRYGL